MLSLLVFAAAVYGLTFLLADARIFGCSAHSFPRNPTEVDFEEVDGEGVIPLRQLFLRSSFFRELLTCYFCLGVWSGMAAHWLFLTFGHLNPNWRNSYFLAGPMDLGTAILGTVIAALVGATSCYAINQGICYLESRNEEEEL